MSQNVINSTFWQRKHAFSLIGLCLLGMIFLSSCSGEEEERPSRPLPPIEEGVDSESYGVTYVFSDSARVTANLMSAHVTEKEEQEGEETKKRMVHYLDGGVKIIVLNAYGQTSSTIVSESAVYERDGGIAELLGNVMLNNYKGEKLETEQLFWDEKKDSVYTDKYVRIETADKIITGSKGLKATSDFSSYTIFGIQGEIETDKELE
ncbi:MAG: LPS export ABC transporter periplasmic protein LptC [Bacteroidia bacterium]